MLLLLVFGDAAGLQGDHPTSVTWLPSGVDIGGVLAASGSSSAIWVVGDAPTDGESAVVISIGDGDTGVIVNASGIDYSMVAAGDDATGGSWTTGQDVAIDFIYLTTDTGDYITTDSGVYIIIGYVLGDNSVIILTGNTPTTVTW